jgi:hypothetical protein
VITQLRRGQRHATAADLTPTAAGTGSQEAAGAAGAPTADDLTQLGNAHPAVADHRAQAADPGHRDDTAVSAGAATSTGDTLDTGRLPACLALTGAGAPAAARGLLVAALATGSDPDPHARAGVVTAATTVDRLLDHADVPALPGLTVVDDVATGLDLLDQHALRRARLLDDHDTDTLTALRTADPGEPLPPIILITDRVDVGQRGRLEALLTVGAQLDLHAVVLGAAVGGTPLEVAADGTTTGDPTPPANGPPGGTGRVTVMAAAEAYTSARRRASESCMRQATTTSQIIHATLTTQATRIRIVCVPEKPSEPTTQPCTR